MKFWTFTLPLGSHGSTLHGGTDGPGRCRSKHPAQHERCFSRQQRSRTTRFVCRAMQPHNQPTPQDTLWNHVMPADGYYRHTADLAGVRGIGRGGRSRRHQQEVPLMP